MLMRGNRKPHMSLRLLSGVLAALIIVIGATTALFSVDSPRHRLTRTRIRAIVVRYRRMAGLKRPGISNHALRHTAATLGYLHTGDLRAVQELLAHANPQMTARYAHMMDRAKKNPVLFIRAKLR